MRKLIHRYSGIGQIETGSAPLSVSYELSEYREMIPAGTFENPNATIEGLGSIEGTLRTQDESPLPFSRSDLILHLANTRRLKIIVTSAAGASARVTGSGGFF